MLTALALQLFYPPVFLGLALAMLVLKFLSVIGAGQIVTFLGNKYASGYSIINWESTRLVSVTSAQSADLARSVACRPTRTCSRLLLLARRLITLGRFSPASLVLPQSLPTASLALPTSIFRPCLQLA